MTLLQAVLLGILQGVSEFLPISSSAHLTLVPLFMKWEKPNLAFIIAIHLGSLLAVFLCFAREWWQVFTGGLNSIIERRIGFDRERILFWRVFVATIPAAIVGVFFHKDMQALFGDPVLLAIPLCLVGFALYWIDGNYPSLRALEEMNTGDAGWIGIAQAFAVIPGVSSVGAVVTMARLLGFNREASARFAIMLTLPIIAASIAFEWRELTEQGHIAVPMAQLVAGFVSSFIVGSLVILISLRLLRYSDYRFLAWYRILLALSVIVWTLLPRN